MRHVEKLQTYVKPLLIPMTLLVPLWLVVGRALLGSLGWLTLLMVFTVIPVLMILLAIHSALILRRPDVRSGSAISRKDAALMAGFYVSIFLFGLFLLDGGDTEDSIGSVATNVFGVGFNPYSGILSIIFGLLATISLGAALVVAIVEFVRARRQPTQPAGDAKLT